MQMNLQDTLSKHVKVAVNSIYSGELESVEFQATRKEFAGDITVVVFPMLRVVKGNPVQIGEQIGNYLVEHVSEVKAFNVVKGFLNIEIDDRYFIHFFNGIKNDTNYGFVTAKPSEKAVMVEYSSPNTNKPLHLGHVRNNLLGYSVAEILKASGKKVYKTQIINDRGIHICKSMLAWKRFAPNGSDGIRETPQTTLNLDLRKGDKLVGHYYVEYNKRLKKDLSNIFNIALFEFSSIRNEENLDTIRLRHASKELKVEKIIEAYNRAFDQYFYYKNFISYDDLLNPNFSARKLLMEGNNSNIKRHYNKAQKNFNNQSVNVKKYLQGKEIKFPDRDSNRIFRIILKELEGLSPLHKEAQQMLQQWESGDEEVVALWKKMNDWVYDGFNETYKNLGVDFDKLYFESETYLLGKEFVAEGLKTGVFYKREDGSVWCDLTEDGLDEKIVLRSDGTAVYMTQDIGTAIQRVKDFPDVGGMVYTVGNEQEYHFQVLFLIIKKLGFEWAKNLYHLSYGMVDLPSGKMKSREGTVVDADDLIVEMAATAEEISEDLGKLDGYSSEEKQELYKTIGLGALKYYILKVDPRKRILFDPKESIDFQGNTGPFIQYTYARIQSVLRKADLNENVTLSEVEVSLHPKEKEVLKQLQLFPEVIQNAAEHHSPALIANYTYDLVKAYNSFFQNLPIVIGNDNEVSRSFRIGLSKVVANVIKNAFGLLGIDVPERM